MKKSNWLTFLINGLIALIIGSLLLFIPEKTILTLTWYFGLLLLIAGIVLLIISIRNMRSDQPYIIQLTEALAAIFIGFMLVMYTRQSLQMFVILLGIWALIIGIIQMIISFRFREEIGNNKLLLANGIITTLVGILLFFNPFTSLIVLEYIVGILALAVGRYTTDAVQPNCCD